MATETRDQSASLAEVSRRIFTDPAGLPHSKNEDIGRSQTHLDTCGNQAYLWTTQVVMEKLIPISLLSNTRNIGKEVIVERRLYFLLPDAAHARAVVAKLETNGIERKYTHVIAAQGINLEGLPLASPNQRMDLGARLETIFWDGNLVLFFLALMALIVLTQMNVSGFWLLVPATIMLSTFIVGVGFTKYIPNVHLSEFVDALRHREILLMVDVPVGQVARVEKLVHSNHPEAVAGGVGWHIDALQI